MGMYDLHTGGSNGVGIVAERFASSEEHMQWRAIEQSGSRSVQMGSRAPRFQPGSEVVSLKIKKMMFAILTFLADLFLSLLQLTSLLNKSET